jgi:transposase
MINGLEAQRHERRLTVSKHIRAEKRLTIGIDLGDKHSYYTVLDESGETIEAGRVATTAKGFQRRFGPMEPALVAIEVGTHSPWVSRLLESCGHEVLVANARKLRLIYENDNKSDAVDAELLARVARLDPRLLSPIQHRDGNVQADLAILRSRNALVKARTQLVNSVRGAVKSWGSRLKTCSTSSFHKQAPAHIPKELKPALKPVLQMIGSLTTRIRAFDKQIVAVAQQRYPEVDLLQQVGGVGPITALCFILTIEDPHRIKTRRSVGAYLGLRPGRDQSGGKDPQLRITKAGDRELRRLLIGSAHYILGPFGPDSDLRRWGLALVSRGGKSAKKRAVVAVARKLSVLLLTLWVNAEVYEPLRNTMARAQERTVEEKIPA